MSASNGVVYVVEDDASFRKSMERLIRASGFEVHTFESAKSFLAQAAVGHPGCILLDVQLPDIDGLRLQEKLLEKGYNLPVIFMTGHGTIPMSVQAMKKGAVDFLPKPLQTKNLIDAIHQAIERNISDVQKDLDKKKINALIDKLTAREKEIMRWVITGMLNKQIAYHLGITERTVKAHRRSIMQKLKVSSVAELVRLADKADMSPAE